ncbi:hypothetical protein O0I10_005733 [Lichtheimia ornata]|uniref:Uncharacterized protein n=1 Tax=Lichtheimia ornata TaxID=688661 RepID=A0AAD7V4X6_9FUNG|nr:uncharacterized protein O0I10_005733 [Lichtheimia ornata]KAJ8658693.1 hypothetical protein O0I10_005733 [Lichtheimia ornata]
MTTGLTQDLQDSNAYTFNITMEYIRGLSHAKLAHSNQDLRKSVLITNTLQNVHTINKIEVDGVLEQEWLNTCLDELHIHDNDVHHQEQMEAEPLPPSLDTRQDQHATTTGWLHDCYRRPDHHPYFATPTAAVKNTTTTTTSTTSQLTHFCKPGMST